MPVSPRITASAWAVVSTMQIVRWHRAATASGEASTLAPAATSGSSWAGLMSCTTSSNPAFTRLSAIGPPILPSPINPTLPAIGFLLTNGGDRSISWLTGNLAADPEQRQAYAILPNASLYLGSAPAPCRLGQQRLDALPFRIGQIAWVTPPLKRGLTLAVLFRPHPPYVA